MKQAVSLILSLALLVSFCLALGGCGCAAGDKYEVAVFAYKYDDSYIASVREALKESFREHKSEVRVTFYNGENNQQTQSTQIDTALTRGVDLLLVNAVDFQAAGESLAKKAKDAGVPCIFFNREVSDTAVATASNICFVGTDPDAPGYMQGELVADLLSTNEAFRQYDRNGDGKIQYAMFRAEVGNAEADGRTKYSVSEANRLLAENESLTSASKNGDILVRVGADQLANWDSATANSMMSALFRVSGGNPNIELVLCNNDDMALGVISALNAAGYNREGSRGTASYIPVYGVDALATATDAIREGKMEGTVRQDGNAMAEAIVAISMNLLHGKSFLDGTEYTFEEGGRKLRIPYSSVQADKG